jgi:hypothetical protein
VLQARPCHGGSGRRALAMIWATMLGIAQDSTNSDSSHISFTTPSATNPFMIYLVVMFVLWLLARRGNKKATFTKQAQEVLDEKYASGEITKKAYDKFRQDVSLRPKR